MLDTTQSTAFDRFVVMKASLEGRMPTAQGRNDDTPARERTIRNITQNRDCVCVCECVRVRVVAGRRVRVAAGRHEDVCVYVYV